MPWGENLTRGSSILFASVVIWDWTVSINTTAVISVDVGALPNISGMWTVHNLQWSSLSTVCHS